MDEKTDVAQRTEQATDSRTAAAQKCLEDSFWLEQGDNNNARVVPRMSPPWRAAPSKQLNGPRRSAKQGAELPGALNASSPEIETPGAPAIPTCGGGLSADYTSLLYDREEAKRIRMAADTLANPSSPAVVSIETDKEFGTGFFVDKSGYIVTANNILKNAKVINVTTFNGDRYTATVTTRDERYNIALIKTDQPPQAPQTIKFGDSAVLQDGDEVRSRGYSSREFARSYSGKIKFLTSGDRLYTQDIPYNATLAGAPVTNPSGEFVGMLSGSIGETSLSTSSLSIAEMLSRATSKFELSYQTGGRAGRHLDALRTNPFVAPADAALLGTGAYALRRATIANPGLTALGMGPLAITLANVDAMRLFDSKSEPQLIGSGLALASDAVIGTGAVMMLKEKRLAFGVAAVGLLGRLATEFYPSHPKLTVHD